MKIYTVFQGKVHELEVKETAKLYIAKDNYALAFGCVTRFTKESCATSPAEAVATRTNELNSRRQRLKDQMHQIDSELVTLHKLELAKQYQ